MAISLFIFYLLVTSTIPDYSCTGERGMEDSSVTVYLSHCEVIGKLKNVLKYNVIYHRVRHFSLLYPTNFNT